MNKHVIIQSVPSEVHRTVPAEQKQCAEDENVGVYKTEVQDSRFFRAHFPRYTFFLRGIYDYLFLYFHIISLFRSFHQFST